MTSTEQPQPAPPDLVVAARDGATVHIAQHGGHVCRWRTADGVERLYLSPLPRQPGEPIRGGIPVVFPQFANRGPLSMHGFARTLPWTLGEPMALPDGRGRLTAALADTPATRALWPHPFRLDLTVTVGADALVVELLVRNTGEAPFEFGCALHTYIATRGEAVRIDGLERRPYVNNNDGTPGLDDADGPLVVDRATGRFYFGVADPLTLRDRSARVIIRQEGFRDVVVWNPGAHPPAPLPGLPPDGYRQFVCVEGAVIEHPVRLAPGAFWRGAQHLLATGDAGS
ncbi:MAG: D-hexose-6-phosphate mutarotase [Betaproteobacteria bacterium]